MALSVYKRGGSLSIQYLVLKNDENKRSHWKHIGMDKLLCLKTEQFD